MIWRFRPRRVRSRGPSPAVMVRESGALRGRRQDVTRPINRTPLDPVFPLEVRQVIQLVLRLRQVGHAAGARTRDGRAISSIITPKYSSHVRHDVERRRRSPGRGRRPRRNPRRTPGACGAGSSTRGPGSRCGRPTRLAGGTNRWRNRRASSGSTRTLVRLRLATRSAAFAGVLLGQLDPEEVVLRVAPSRRWRGTGPCRSRPPARRGGRCRRPRATRRGPRAWRSSKAASVDRRRDRGSGGRGRLIGSGVPVAQGDADDPAVEDHVRADEPLGLEDRLAAVDPGGLGTRMTRRSPGLDLAPEADVLHPAEADEARLRGS